MSQVRATKQEAKTAEEANTCCKHRRLTESIAQSAVSACEHKRPKTSRLTMSSGRKRNLASYYAGTSMRNVAARRKPKGNRRDATMVFMVACTAGGLDTPTSSAVPAIGMGAKRAKAVAKAMRPSDYARMITVAACKPNPPWVRGRMQPNTLLLQCRKH